MSSLDSQSSSNRAPFCRQSTNSHFATTVQNYHFRAIGANIAFENFVENHSGGIAPMTQYSSRR